mgnify:CR=1 FL=1|tara:strand:+ start:126 stop:518 length:393 start_codon:yes stop_codon:yes gene_type:complete
MNKEITITVKNRLSQSDFKKIDFDEPVDKFHYYGDHPIKRLTVENYNYVTYIIKYYLCRKSDTRTIFEQKNLQVDMYKDRFQIVGYEKLKSEEKELFSSIVSDVYLEELLQKDAIHELEMFRLRKELNVE